MKKPVCQHVLLIRLVSLRCLLPGSAYASATVSGTVFLDHNRNLRVDEGEPGVPGGRVHLTLRASR